ncbi:MAG TPA: UDP-N-acetylglucosamine 2-epimerase [Vitreimonas sp.]|nr:UDP-N-acetylglucosamine 2-epimerase [Vitreimonas sp.]
MMRSSKKINQSSSQFVFFVGTTAEFIKLLPVLKELEAQQLPYLLVSSGQNNLKGSELFEYLELKKPHYILTQQKPKQSPLVYLGWFFSRTIKGIWQLRKLRQQPAQDRYFIVHGDTVSTLMGAVIGKLLGYNVVHLEAGLRSFNWWQPFPEEITRVLVSKLVNLHFAPNEWALKNLSKHRGVKVNTQQNTLLDSLHLVLSKRTPLPFLKPIKNQAYFVCVIHRQENLMNQSVVTNLLDEILTVANQHPGVFILHHLTETYLKQYDLLEKLKSHPNIILTPRLEYPTMMQLLAGCEFIITDGGSNQEESYYLGKPCLVMRTTTERIEGLDHNVVISQLDPNIIHDFVAHYSRYRKSPVKPAVKPSQIIVRHLQDHTVVKHS